MKGLWAKKHAKMKKQQPELEDGESSDFGTAIKITDMEKINQVNIFIIFFSSENISSIYISKIRV